MGDRQWTVTSRVGGAPARADQTQDGLPPEGPLPNGPMPTWEAG